MSLRRIAAAVLACGVIAVACGTSEKLEPAAAVAEAVEETFGSDGVRFTLSLAGETDDVVTMLAGGEELTDDDEQAIRTLAASRLSVSGQGDLDTVAEEQRFALDARIGDVDHAVEVRGIGKQLYARAEVERLVDLFGGDFTEIESYLAEADAAGFRFLRTAASGGWIGTDLAPLESFLKGLGSGGETGLPEMPDADAVQQLADSLEKLWESDVTVTRLNEEDAGMHYEASIPLRRAYDLLSSAMAGMPGVPGGSFPPPGEVPDRDVAVDLWIDDGELRRVELDLGQFDPPASSGPVAVRIDIDSLDEPIVAPDGAEMIDLIELFGRFAGLFGTTD